MQALVLLMLLGSGFVPFFVDNGWLPGVLTLFPEMISAAATLLLLGVGVRTRFKDIDPAYVFGAAGLVLVMVFGAVANAVGSGPLISGARLTLRALPFFLIPAVYSFSEQQVRRQLLAVLLVTLVQLPIAVLQKRGEIYWGNTSGDFIEGTLGGSGTLSIFLISSACVLTAFFLRGRLSLSGWLVLLALCVAPTTINETKATFVLLPIGLVVTFWVAAERERRLAGALAGALSVVFLFGVLVPAYNFWAQARDLNNQSGRTITEFLTDPRALEDYMNFDSGKEGALVGRGAAYRMTAQEVSREPVMTGLGLGLGNASVSRLGEGFTGRFGRKYVPVMQTSMIRFVLELGVLGAGLILLLHWRFYRDARSVAADDPGFWGALGAGWAGVTAVIVVAAFYADLLISPAIAYPFMYFTGVLAAHRVRHALGAQPVAGLVAT